VKERAEKRNVEKKRRNVGGGGERARQRVDDRKEIREENSRSNIITHSNQKY